EKHLGVLFCSRLLRSRLQGSGDTRVGISLRMTMADDGHKLVARWRAGDQQAAAELFGRYANRLIALARSRLSARLAQRVDPEDVVQSVCRSFFADAREGRYAVERGGDLWQLLVTMTLHKVQDQGKRHGRAKRDLQRETNFGSEDSLVSLHASV